MCACTYADTQACTHAHTHTHTHTHTHRNTLSRDQRHLTPDGPHGEESLSLSLDTFLRDGPEGGGGRGHLSYLESMASYVVFLRNLQLCVWRAPWMRAPATSWCQKQYKEFKMPKAPGPKCKETKEIHRKLCFHAQVLESRLTITRVI